MKSSLGLEVELIRKSVNASSGRDPGSASRYPDQIFLSGIIKGLRMTASSKLNSNTDLKRIDETCGNTTIEAVVLSVSEKKFLIRKCTLITNISLCNLYSEWLPKVFCLPFQKRVIVFLPPCFQTPSWVFRIFINNNFRHNSCIGTLTGWKFWKRLIIYFSQKSYWYFVKNKSPNYSKHFQLSNCVLRVNQKIVRLGSSRYRRKIDTQKRWTESILALLCLGIFSRFFHTHQLVPFHQDVTLHSSTFTETFILAPHVRTLLGKQCRKRFWIVVFWHVRDHFSPKAPVDCIHQNFKKQPFPQRILKC